MISYISKHYIIEENGIITDASDFFCEFIEYSRNELIGKTIKAFFSQLRINVNVEDLTTIETFLFTKSLEVRNINIYKLEIEKNKNKYLIHEIPNSRFEYKNQAIEKMIIDNISGVGVYTVPDFMLIKANQTYLNYLPKPYNTKETVYGKYVREFIKEFEGSAGQKTWNRIIEANQLFIVEEKPGLLLSGDNHYWDNILIPIGENGYPKLLVSILNDVSDRVLSKEHIAEQAKIIRDQNKKLEVIFRNISDGLAVIDSNRNFTLQTDIFKSIFDTGFKDENAVFFVNGVLTSYEKLPLFSVLENKRVLNERVIIRKDTGEQHINLSAIPVLDDNGEFTYGIVTANDITAFIESQKILEQMHIEFLETEKEKNAILEASIKHKDEFLSLISHEFKTPLTVINSALQTMEIVCKNELSPKAMKYLNKIRQNSYRQLRLVNNILDISKINAGSIKINKKNIDVVLLTKAITDSVQLFAIQRGIDLSFTTAFSEKIIGVDDEKYERILLNLLSNAIKFTPAGKSVNVHLKMKKEYVFLSVQDDGVGIPKDKQDIIFNRFEQVSSTLTRNSEGTGLGLTLVKNIVEALGGKILVDSELGIGSTFTVLLPKDKVNEDGLLETASYIMDNRLTNEIAVEFSDIYVDNFSVTENESSNPYKKIQKLLEREATLKAICSELSNFTDLKSALTEVLHILRQLVKCEALGIRLCQDGDYPYYVYQGFSDEFIKSENSLWSSNNCCGKPIVECICGRIINGEINKDLSFYTKKGSFWTNDISTLSRLIDEIKKSTYLRRPCVKSGYKSIALIPISLKGKIIGLIQLNDSNKDMFSIDTIEFLEILGDHVGMAIEINSVK